MRDAWIGWGPTEVLEEIRAKPTEERARWLLRTFDKVLEETYIQDFLEDGLLLPEDLRQVRPGVVERLVGEGRVVRDGEVVRLG